MNVVTVEYLIKEQSQAKKAKDTIGDANIGNRVQPPPPPLPRKPQRKSMKRNN